MPKKGKKGKRGKKGKKGGKRGNGKKESVLKLAVANSKLWEAKLDIAEKSKNEFRDSAKRLMLENDVLQSQMCQSEQDMIEVITFLKKQDEDKDTQLEQQLQQMRDVQKEHQKQKEKIVEDFSKQINDLEGSLGEKMREIDLLHNELKLVKEFRQMRGQMQRQLREIKDAMLRSEDEHRAVLARTEQKFLDEKLRLQQEANHKISELAGKAHTQAIQNLDETTKSVYKENVRLSEALSYHMKEQEFLKKERDRLLEENANLRQQNEVNDLVVHDKILQSKQQNDVVRELNEKVKILEKSLSHVVREFEEERRSIMESQEVKHEAAKVEIIKLQRVIELKTREMNKVKRLAKNILDGRSELEQYFLVSLDQVKAEIAANRSQYRKDAHAAYQQKMLAAHACKGDYPKIRTFSHMEHSTNSVFRDIQAAEIMYDVGDKVDISDLTWEQKEKVLRYLFARMNVSRRETKTVSLPNIQMKSKHGPSIPQSQDWEPATADHTFLTQAQPDMLAQLGPISQLDTPPQPGAQLQFLDVIQSETAQSI